MARVVVVSNCQCQPLAAAWNAMRPEDDVRVYEAHTLIGNSLACLGAKRRLDLADIIVSIPISDDYPVEFARSAYIRSLTQSEKIVVPMMFFEGLHPDITYLGESTSRLRSPLGDYNSRIVLRSFLKGLHPNDAAALFQSPQEYQELGYFDHYNQSIEELKRRDRECHFSGSEILEPLLLSSPTFFTINHPTDHLMRELVIRTFQHLSLSFTPVPVEFITPTLAMGPVWPIFDFLLEKLGANYPQNPALRANEGGMINLSVQDFVAKSYISYYLSIRNLPQARQAVDEMDRLGVGGSTFLEDLHLHHKQTLAPLIGGPERETMLRSVGLSELIRMDFSSGDNLATSMEEAETIKTALWSDPTDIFKMERYGALLEDQGSLEHAADVFLGAAELQLDPENLDQYIHYLQVKYSAAGARSALKILAARGEASPSMWMRISDIAGSAGDAETSLEAAERAASLAPNDRGPLTVLAHRLADLNYLDLALAQLSILRQQFGENSHDWALEGLIYRRLGKFRESERGYRNAIRLEPHHPPFQMGLQETLISAGGSASVGL